MNCACGCGSKIVSLGAARFDVVTGKWCYRTHYNAMMVERQEAHQNPSIREYLETKKRMEIGEAR